jgi:uncharacterized phage protein gp47/JayE
MSLNLDITRKEIIDRMKSDVQARLPESDPFLRNSFLLALITALGGRVSEVYEQLKLLLDEIFPDTASGDYLKRWGNWINITQNAATKAVGNAVVTGTLGSSIPAATRFQSQSGNEYTSQVSRTIIVNENVITTLTYSSGTVTAVTSGEHNYASNIQVIISGAVETAYNGTFTIFVISNNSFTYEIDTAPSSPATGSPKASANTASILIESNAFGADQNLGSGASLSVTTPLAGINSTAYVQFDEIAGGTDIEDESILQARIEDGYQNPNTPFNTANIIDQARKVSGVTRVFVESPDTTLGSYSISALTQTSNVARAVFASPHGLTSGMYISISGANQLDYNVSNTAILVINNTTIAYIISNNPVSPATGTITASFSAVQPGQVKVAFTRDNDPDIIPSGAEVDAVKQQLLTIKPAHMSDNNLIVVSPIAKPVAFTFTSITPNTTTMQNAIEQNLEQFFRETPEYGENLLALDYNAAIKTTIDPETGEALQNFVLSTPSGNVTVASGELPTLDSVAFL